MSGTEVTALKLNRDQVMSLKKLNVKMAPAVAKRKTPGNQNPKTKTTFFVFFLLFFSDSS